MIERPIPYTGDMIRARRAGRKTQTRRMRGLKVINATPNDFQFLHIEDGDAVLAHGTTPVRVKCPYGLIGDRLWVREALRFSDNGIVYEADGAPLPPAIVPESAKTFVRSYRPPMLMPRWASRGLDEITDIRLQRLQSITGMDAKAEGVAIPAHMPQDGADLDYARWEYFSLWDCINGKTMPAKMNPWLWAVTFKVLV